MKLVPLGDRVVLKQAEPEEKTTVRNNFNKTDTGKTTTGRSNCSRSRWSC